MKAFLEAIMKTLDDGSVRRFVAFVLVLVVICLSHWLNLGADALTALTTLALGYIGQGTVKAVFDAKQQATEAQPDPDPIVPRLP